MSQRRKKKEEEKRKPTTEEPAKGAPRGLCREGRVDSHEVLVNIPDVASHVVGHLDRVYALHSKNAGWVRGLQEVCLQNGQGGEGRFLGGRGCELFEEADDLRPLESNGIVQGSVSKPILRGN